MPEDPKNRRQHERFPASIQVDYRSGDTFLFSYIQNISVMGIFIRSDEPLPVGTQIELVGYDLDLPNDGYVGAGQTFAVTWYWKVMRQVPGGFKVFLHVDGQGNRLNGDHDPVDGRYPVRLWDEGDVVVDRQELTVPANYRPGTYTFYIGFYSGSTRLHVEQGREDDADRVIAGTVTVR